ncbi:MAG: glutaminyl-peptide cyclotransferase [Flavobacteriaceae bacterium]|nr:MAG: glutaminyl-peptide cyclotransferase [Flavobacteriaceae bacterium]
MNVKKYSIFLLLTIALFSSCEKPYQFRMNAPKSIKLNDSFTVMLNEKTNRPVDSVQFFVNGFRYPNSTKNSCTLNSVKTGLGKHAIKALVFYPGKVKKINSSIEVLSDIVPVVYTYKVINTYPHDSTAYTQGLEYHKGFLYESTGQKGQSSIRKVDLKTGKVLQKAAIDDDYFGEGITIFNNKIHFLTWKAKKGFVYNLDTFQPEKEFSYNKSPEGWGFTHNNTELIKSDGTHKIWFLDPETHQEKRAIRVYHHKAKVKDLNELEFINGVIYANYWKKPTIAIIDPETGAVKGLANLAGLQKEVQKTQKLQTDDVLNGIAFDAKNNRLFVTGKNWAKLFEIELIKK